MKTLLASSVLAALIGGSSGCAGQADATGTDTATTAELSSSTACFAYNYATGEERHGGGSSLGECANLAASLANDFCATDAAAI